MIDFDIVNIVFIAKMILETVFYILGIIAFIRYIYGNRII